MLKRLSVFLLSLMLICSFVISSSSWEAVDFNADGSVSVTMRYQDAPVTDGSLTLYHVADLCWNNEEYEFTFTDSFVDCMLSFEGLDTEETAGLYAEYVQKHDVKGTVKEVDHNGIVLFEALPLGLYLIVQEDATDGFSPAKPFMITVPMTVEGTLSYHVDASPKLSLIPDAPPKEPDEPDTPDTPPSIPQTGQLKWPIPVLAVSGILLFSFGWVICFRQKRAY